MLGYIFIFACISVVFTLVINQVTSMQTDRNYIIEHDFAVHNEINSIEKICDGYGKRATRLSDNRRSCLP